MAESRERMRRARARQQEVHKTFWGRFGEIKRRRPEIRSKRSG